MEWRKEQEEQEREHKEEGYIFLLAISYLSKKYCNHCDNNCNVNEMNVWVRIVVGRLHVRSKTVVITRE